MYGRRCRASAIHGIAGCPLTDVWGIDPARAGVDSGRMMTIDDLQAFHDSGWNRHDVDVLMTFMADECVFESTAGPEVCGARHAGRERVRRAFARVFEVFPDARFDDARTS